MSQPAAATLVSPLDINDIERLHALVRRSEIEQLALASKIRFSVGVESAFIHWLTNWARRSSKREISLLPGPDEKKDIGDANLDSPFVIAMGLCVTKSLTGDGGADNTSKAKTYAYSQLTEKQLNLFSKDGLTVGEAIFCADSLSLPLPSKLYQSAGDVAEVRSRDHFESLFEKLASEKGSIIPLFGNEEGRGVERSLIPTFVHELFRNTHDHGRTLIDGGRVPASTRGIYTRLHNVSLDALSRSVDSPFFHFCQKVANRLALNRTSKISLLEISVFDNGPGLAQTRSNKQLNSLTINQEREWFEACFQRFSSGVPADFNRGLGLARVQSALSKLSAFLRVRTGRLAMCRDFSLFPYGEKVIFFDTATGGLEIHEHPEVDGALFNVFIPCREIE